MDNILPEELISEWGLKTLPKEKQMEIVGELGRMVYQAVLVRSLDILSESEQEEFDVLLDQDTTTPQEVLSFLASKIPTFNYLRVEEINKIKQSMLIPTTPVTA